MWELLVIVSFLGFSSGNHVGFGHGGQTIVGGNATTIENYPYMVALLHTVDGVKFYQYCGGSILTAKAILTAAHCPFLDNPANWKARVGSTYASSGGTVYDIASFVIHPNFDRITLNFDVSIMRPSTPISFADVAKPANIATSSFVVMPNMTVWAAGWGVTDSGMKSEILRHVQYKIVDHEVCVAMYAVRHLTVTNNMICAGDIVHGGKDQCYADSGGPLVHNGVVIGIASGGDGCGNPKFPGIDTNVAKFYDWIQAELAKD